MSASLPVSIDSAPASPRDDFERYIALTYQRAVHVRAGAEDMLELAARAGAWIAVLGGDPGFDARLPMQRLAARLALSAAQVELVWTIVACSIDARIVAHLEALGGGHARRGASVALYATLAELDDDSAAQLAHWLDSANPLVASGLLVAAEQASAAARAYTASARLVDFLLDADHVIAPLAVVEVPDDPIHDDAQRVAIAELAAMFDRIRFIERVAPVIVIEGPLGSGRATAAAAAAGRTLVAVDLAQLAGARLADALVALRRECLLHDAIPVLANADHAFGDADGERRERRLVGDFIDSLGGPVVVTATIPGSDLGTRRALVRIPWPGASSGVREALWRQAAAAIGARVEGDLAGLAHRYRVGPAAIRRAVQSIQISHAPSTPLAAGALAAGLRHNIAEQLGGLAHRVEVTQTWEDLVVSDDIADQIRALVGRIAHAHRVLDTWGFRRKLARGAGAAALFSGPPGTGKTMVAGLIARELDLELYQVDLGKVVSKWIGETEKNLARVFDAAEEGHALLLFDEADALFGQRTTDMKSATDRYANLEVNYLLQRVEAFGGITILTTNLDTAIDAALKRRLASHIVFATPDEDERAVLWERSTTTDTAPITDDIDHPALARAFPNMSGANIRNAALAAAFLAATEDSSAITFDHLVRAARAEYRSMGHMVVDTHRRSL